MAVLMTMGSLGGIPARLDELVYDSSTAVVIAEREIALVGEYMRGWLICECQRRGLDISHSPLNREYYIEMPKEKTR